MPVRRGSVLLHALSLHDRILEPKQLPLQGRVWAYDKRAISREMFVGNCITLLSLMGYEGASLQWDDEIMAFDVRDRQGHPATIVISLHDDSMASDYFFFFGIWIRPQGNDALRVAARGISSEERLAADEDLLPPAFSYALTAWHEGLPQSLVRRILGQELFAQRLGESWNLYGQTRIDDRTQMARFVLCPEGHPENVGEEVQHALYSLRNLMALMGRGLQIHDRAADTAPLDQLAEALRSLQQQLLTDEADRRNWRKDLRAHARLALRHANDWSERIEMDCELQRIRRLFDAIVEELDIRSVDGCASLIHRMKAPLIHAGDELGGRLRMLERLEREIGILQRFMHSRIATEQLELLHRFDGENSQT